MKIIFMGTPDFAVPSLKALIEAGYSIAAVVTQPDRPKGRKRILTPTPVKVEALRHQINVLQPNRLRDAGAIEEIARLRPDLIITVAYGQIFPKSLLDLPKHGCINVHGSLLPKYRGGAPIQHAIINGEQVTGVTIMYMAEGLDTGDMISHVEVPIGFTDTTGTMFDKLSYAGAQLLLDTLPDVLTGKLKAIPQNNEESTVARNLKREDERIDWNRTSKQIYNQVRGLNPWPGAFTLWNNEVLKLWSCRYVESGDLDRGRDDPAPRQDRLPGTILHMSAAGIEVKTGDSSIWLTTIQPAGKKAMDVAQFSRGSSIPVGTVLT